MRYSFLVFFLLCLVGQMSANHTSGLETDPVPGRKMISVVEHLGRTHFKVRTKSATYLYDPIAGGFSSILDKDENDWIAYKDDPTPAYPAAAATSYRGLPNLVYQGEDDGAGHPGFDKCESRIVGRNKIHTVSRSGEWAWTWTFFSDAARLDMVKVAENRPYWFLYEGPAGGSYLPASTFWATETTAPSYRIHDHYAGDIYRGKHKLFYFGERMRPVVFFMAQLTPDEALDHFSLLGNAQDGALKSTDGMVVAGFGRNAGAKPLLTGKHSFLVGFVRHDPPVVPQPGTADRIRSLIRRRGKMRNFFPSL